MNGKAVTVGAIGSGIINGHRTAGLEIERVRDAVETACARVRAGGRLGFPPESLLLLVQALELADTSVRRSAREAVAS